MTNFIDLGGVGSTPLEAERNRNIKCDRCGLWLCYARLETECDRSYFGACPIAWRYEDLEEKVQERDQ